MNERPTVEVIKRKKTSSVAFLLILGGIFALALAMVQPYLLSVFMGGVLALLLQPFYARLLKLGLRRNSSALLVTLALVVLVIGPLTTLGVVASKQATALGAYLSEQKIFSLDSIIGSVSKWRPVRALVDDPAQFEQQVHAGLQSFAGSASKVIVGIAASLPALGLQLVLACLSCFFLLIDGRRFVDWLEAKLPVEKKVAQNLRSAFRNTAVSTVWATLAAASTQAALMIAGFFALGIPAAVLAGGATFIFAWIPMIGSAPVWLAGTAYLFFVKHSILKALAMLALGVFTSVIDNFIRPLVLKGKGEMHPFVALIAIFGGIQLFGLVGVFVGPIIVALLIALLQIWPELRRRDDLDEAAMRARVPASVSRDGVPPSRGRAS